MYLFYTPDIASSLTLAEEESQHCVQVLRTERGEQILVTDGLGQLYHCEVTNPHRKHCEVKILSVETPEPLHEGYVHIAIAPTKNIDRLEWMIEKCTEMGVDEITPLLCRHSERKTVNSERLKKIMVSAAKQSLKTTFPRLNELTSYADFIKGVQADDRFIAHCMTEEETAAEGGQQEGSRDNEGGQLRDASRDNEGGQQEGSRDNEGGLLRDAYKPTEGKNALWQLARRGSSTVVLIGPEGDFSPEEVKLALSQGFKPCSLGKARLRTETAGLFACNTLILVNS